MRLHFGLRRRLRRRAEGVLRFLHVLEAPAAAHGAPAPAAESTLRARVEVVLDDLIRPGLHADGGDIELVDVVGNDITIRLVGACRSCPSSAATLSGGIDRLLRDELPEIGAIHLAEGAP